MIRIKQIEGFNLIELMVTISVAAILLAISAPNLKKTIQNNRLSALHNELLSSLNFARSTAITRGSWSTLCNANETNTDCGLPDANWSNGWIVFNDKNNNGVVENNEEVLSLKSDISDSLKISSSRNRITFGSGGYAIGYTGNITFCDGRGDAAKSGMIISNMGRIRVATSDDNLVSCNE